MTFITNLLSGTNFEIKEETVINITEDMKNGTTIEI